MNSVVGADSASNAVPACVVTPRRYWWLKRFALFGAIYFLTLLGGRIWWGYYAGAKLEEQIAEIRRRGEPLFVEDFRPVVFTGENAADLLNQASAKLTPAPCEPVDCPTDAKDRGVPAVRRFVRKNGAVWRLVRSTRTCNGADWHTPVRSPVIMLMFPTLSPLRQLCRASCLAARYEHLVRNDAAAIEHVRDVLAVSRHTEAHQPPSLIAHMIAMAGSELASSAVEALAPRLEVASRAAESAIEPPQPAERAAVKALIAELLDEAPLHGGLVQAMFGERLFVIDTAQAIWNSQMPTVPWSASTFFSLPAPVNWAVRPMWQLDAIRMLDFSAGRLRAAAAADWPAAKAQLPDEESILQAGLRRPATLLSSRFLPSVNRAIELHFRALALRRMAAVALALRLCELDHGARPSTLAVLAPDYLPAIPVDVFDPNGGPVRYAPQANPPVLYSIGVDGLDDGGRFAFKDSGAVDYEQLDQVFFLNGDRPHPPPTPQYHGLSGVSPNDPNAPADDGQTEDETPAGT